MNALHTQITTAKLNALPGKFQVVGINFGPGKPTVWLHTDFGDKERVSDKACITNRDPRAGSQL